MSDQLGDEVEALQAQLEQAQYNLKMLQADFDLESKKKYAVLAENTKLLAALQIARDKGEHYPFCGMPPREVMNDYAAHREWSAARREACSTPEGKKAWWKKHCVCWKGEIEALLAPKEEA